jgi:hypothetical protein
MVYSVWRVAAVAYFILGTAGVLMKVAHPGYAGGTRGLVTAIVLMAASSWWLYRNEIQPRLVASDQDGGLARP